MRPTRTLLRLGITTAIFGLAVVVYMLRPAADVASTGAGVPNSVETQTHAGLPRLLDLGADKCVPCKMMAPILVKLEKAYLGKASIVFIDVWKNKAQAKRFGIRGIPTQIFFDQDGKEIFRHTGFYDEKSIVSQLTKMGVAESVSHL